jgi:hypothetical protein
MRWQPVLGWGSGTTTPEYGRPQSCQKVHFKANEVTSIGYVRKVEHIAIAIAYDTAYLDHRITNGEAQQTR